MRNLVAAIVLPLALAACATSVTNRGLAIQQKSDQIMASCAQDAELLEIGALKDRTNFLSSDSMSLQMYASSDIADDEEKEAIAKLWDSVRQCGERYVSFLETDLDKGLAAMWRKDVNRQLLQLADLHNGAVTWGSFNRDLRRYDNEFRWHYELALKMYWNNEYATAERRQAAFGAALQAYGNALKNYGNTYARQTTQPSTVQQMPIYDPVRTSCRGQGDRVTCTQNSNLMTAPAVIRCRVNGSVMTCTEQ
jgi:hypothetical protein